MNSRFFAAILTLAFASSNGFAHECSEVLLHSTADKIGWDFRNAEFEAKFLGDKQVFQRLRSLVGETIRLPVSGNGEIQYQVQFNKEHRYYDVYYDTKALALYKTGGLLRKRERWDKSAHDREFQFKKVLFQAKGGDKTSGTLNSAFMTRDEIVGQGRKKPMSGKKTKRLLQTDSRDEAVLFARSLIDSADRLSPALGMEQKRFFMVLTPVDGAPPNAPSFYLSLDEIKFSGLRGLKEEFKMKTVELETLDILTSEDPERLRMQISTTNSLAEYLQHRFILAPLPQDKYSLGVENTILSQPR